MNNQDFLDKLDWEGWDYMLSEISSEEIKDKKLKELHKKASKAFEDLRDYVDSFEGKND